MKRNIFGTINILSLCLFLTACGSDNSSPSSNNDSVVTPLPIVTNSGDTPNKLAILDTAGTVERISTDSTGQQADQNSINSSISNDGQIVVFDSSSSNLVSNDTNVTFDIFAKNRRDNTTQRISVATDGSQANGSSVDPKVTANGRYVVFSSDASNLVPNDTNAVSDIFLHDSLTGITTLISKDNNGIPGNGNSEAANISSDGRFVVFMSEATNFSLIDNNSFFDIYLHDLSTATTTLISRNALGEIANGASISPDISADGNRVVFASEASNLLVSDGNAFMDVFLKILSSGEILRMSEDPLGLDANGFSDAPSISSDGNVVAYRSNATNIVTGITANTRQIYIKDIPSGKSELVSVNDLGEVANAGSFFSIAINSDGQIVAFYTDADNLVSPDTNQTWDVFIRDRQRQITRLMSVNNAGQIGDGNSFLPSINDNGNYLSFGSSAKNLSVDDSNASWDIFVHVISPLNLPPIAHAGIDQEIILGSLIQLDASLSYDPDATEMGAGPVSSYGWQLVSTPLGSIATISDKTIEKPTFAPDVNGVYVLGVVVNDGVLDSMQATMTITVAANMAPIANFSLDMNMGAPPLTIRVDATSSSDPEGDPLTFSWDFSDPQSGAANSSALVNASHTYNNAGSFTVTLTVTDSVGNQSQAFKIVDVIAKNQAPEILSVASVLSGPAPLTVQFKANATDPDGDSLSYLWDFSDGSADLTSNLENPVHRFDTAGTFTVTIDVSDGESVTQGTIVIIVGSAINFSINEAVIEYEHDDKVSGKISFEASMSMSNGDALALADYQGIRVSVQVDQLRVLDVPLSDFQVEPTKNLKQKIVYRNHYLKVELEPATGEFEFRSERLLLGDQIDNSNGVDFMVTIGDFSVIENIIMQKMPSRFCAEHDERDEGEQHCISSNERQRTLMYRQENANSLH